jgi:hypothetical protein
LLRIYEDAIHDQVLKIQREYYTGTALHYNSMHAHGGADDPACRNLVIAILRSLGIQRLLDVGSATGHRLKDVAGACGRADLRSGASLALVRQAVDAWHTQAVSLLQACGHFKYIVPY